MYNKIILLTFLLAVFFQIECKAGRYIRGDADISKFPYQISLHEWEGLYEPEGICGGSIIGEREILTAAHCMQKETTNYYVRVGSNFPSFGGDIYNVSKVIVHPDYNNFPSRVFDISLLILEKSISFNKNAAPISLPEQDEKIQSNSKVLISGWANAYYNVEYGYHLLLEYSEIETIPNEKCTFETTHRMFCAYTKEKDECIGFSGGPAVINKTLVGIMSWGEGCGDFPRVYTKVSLFVDWIHTEILSNRILDFLRN